MTTKITGGEAILKNLNREIRKIVGRTRAGMLEAALLVKGESQKLVPVDTGNLRGGATAEVFTIGKNIVAGVGFTAAYAVHVHENLEAKHTVGQSKFLENAVINNKSRILSTIRRRARV